MKKVNKAPKGIKSAVSAVINKTNKTVVRHSDVPGDSPASLSHGELAVNTHDAKIFFGDNNQEAREFKAGGSMRKTAYDDAVAGGYKGTELEWLRDIDPVHSDAPKDGNMYVRKNGAWTQVDGFINPVIRQPLNFSPMNETVPAGDITFIATEFVADPGIKHGDTNYQISTDAEFANIIVEKFGIGPVTTFVFNMPFPGTFYWRLRYIDSNNNKWSAFSDPSQFTVVEL